MKQKADLQLLKIVEYDSLNYSTEALEVAKLELQSRNISDESMQSLRDQIEKVSKIQVVQNNVKESIIAKDQAFKSELGIEVTKFWYLYLFMIGFYCIYPLFNIQYNYSSYGLILTSWSLGQVIVFAYVFHAAFHKKKIAWLITLYFSTISIILSLHNLARSIKFVYDNYDQLLNNNVTTLTNLFYYNPIPDILYLLLAIALFALLLWIQSKDKIKNMFNVTDFEYNKHIKRAALIGIVLVGLLIILYALPMWL